MSAIEISKKESPSSRILDDKNIFKLAATFSECTLDGLQDKLKNPQ